MLGTSLKLLKVRGDIGNVQKIWDYPNHDSTGTGKNTRTGGCCQWRVEPPDIRDEYAEANYSF